MNLLKKFSILLIPIFFSACVPPEPYSKKTSTVSTSPTSILDETPFPEEGEGIVAVHTLLYIPHREGDVDKLLATLEENPHLRLTLLFPPRYFEAPDRKTGFNRFRVLRSSNQIEIGLTLDNEPVLPLLANLNLAGDKVSKWGFSFSYPEDAAFQMARGSSKYQKRWGELPSGFIAPHGALSEDIMGMLKRFRLNWVLGKPDSTWGVKFYGGLALLVPNIPEGASEAEGTRTWARTLATWAFDHPFALIDSSDWSDPNFESLFLKEMATLAKSKMDAPLKTASEFVETLGDENQLAKEARPFQNDYSRWVATSLQKKVWQALADARHVVENYKNSGRANLQRLDAATEEMATAESGTLLASLGENQVSNPTVERNFSATLSNIYRLCNAPVPAHLNNLFSSRTFQKATSKPTENDRPFFVEGVQKLTWNDPAGDDFGDGKYIYPTGRYPKGSFDLRDLSVQWNESEITFSASVVNMPSLATSIMLPLLDIYIDINKFAGAGNTVALKKRSSSLMQKEAAWEYAVAMSPLTANLVQSVPGSDPRLLKVQKSSLYSNTFSATFSRTLLRGDPRQWRMSAGIMGTENNRKNEDLTPFPVSASAGERSFGGATVGRSAPPYLDLLISSSEDQKITISAYESGAKILLPFVEAQ